MAYKYCTATNWGKNFFTHEERRQFHLSGHPGEVWVVGDNLYGDQWISKVSGAIKTKMKHKLLLMVKLHHLRLLTMHYQMKIKLQNQDQLNIIYHSSLLWRITKI